MKTTTRNLTLAALAAAVLATAGVAHAKDRDNDRGDGPRGGMMRIIHQIDANDDGAFALDEMTTFISERFSDADADGNAELTSEEIAEAMEGRRGRSDRAGERLLQRVDIDGNGTATLAEINERATEFFVLMDIDNSGVIEEDELPRRGEGRRGGGRK